MTGRSQMRRRVPIPVPGMWMCRSSALARIEVIGRFSFAVISVRLFPASHIVRRRSSSSSVQRLLSYSRAAIFFASKANEAGPGSGKFKRTQLHLF